jgi:NAD(P) transhydrogenase
LGHHPEQGLRHSIQMLADYRRNPLFHHTLDQVDVEFPDLLRAADSVIDHQVRTRYRYYQRNRVEVVFGRARFVDAHRVRGPAPDGAAELLEADISSSPPAPPLSPAGCRLQPSAHTRQRQSSSWRTRRAA